MWLELLMSAFSRHPSPSTDSSNRNSNGTRIYAPNAIFNGGWKSSEYNASMYYCRAKDGRIAVLVTYVDNILRTGDYEEDVQGMGHQLPKRCEGRDLGVPDKLIGVTLTTTDKGTKLDQTPHTKSIVIERMGSFDVHKVSTPLDPGMDLSPRQENEQ